MDYMMLEPYTNECIGFTTDTEVMRELGLTFCQFKRLVMQGKEYKGCVLIEDESNSFDADKFEIEYRLIEETERGTRYYATNDLHIVSVFKNGNKKVLKPRNPKHSAPSVQINYKTRYIYRTCYEAFYGKLEDNERVVLEGKRDVRNLKVVKSWDFAKREKKVCIGDKVYASIKECAEDTHYDRSYIHKMLDGVSTNLLGVRYVD